MANTTEEHSGEEFDDGNGMFIAQSFDPVAPVTDRQHLTI